MMAPPRGMPGGYGQQPGIILLREGTDTSQGKAQLISNINACGAVVDAVRSTLGPRGMDKLMYDGTKVTISNDGATIMKLLDIVHPAARVLAEISMSQDSEVGDGTTSVVLLAGEMLKQVKPFVEDGLHPQTIARGVRKAVGLISKRLAEVAVDMPPDQRRRRLEILSGTALNSKLIANYKDLFAPMVVDAVIALDPLLLDLKLVGVGWLVETLDSLIPTSLPSGSRIQGAVARAIERMPPVSAQVIDVKMCDAGKMERGMRWMMSCSVRWCRAACHLNCGVMATRRGLRSKTSRGLNSRTPSVYHCLNISAMRWCRMTIDTRAN